jgi:alpha,alpha-trehalase
MLNCLPQFDYARQSGAWSYSGEGYEHARVESDGIDLEVRLSTNLQLGLVGARAYGHTSLTEGGSAFAALCWGDGDGPTTVDDAYERTWTTATYWRGWLKAGSFPDHPWRSYLERSALTLKGLSYAPTGAVLAAGTTSLPETPGGERNWTTASPGSATRRSCSGLCSRWASSGRPTSSSPSCSRR